MNDGTPHHFPYEHTDYFTQTIEYGVSPDFYNDLDYFDVSVTVDRTNGELAATCHEEAANFLALNLAHDILTGERSVDEARQFYAETVATKKAGGSPDYMQAFQFDLPKGDPDETILTDDVRQEAKQRVQEVGSD